MDRWTRAAVLAAVLAAPAGLRAQETPEQVAVAYFEAYRDGRLEEMTALTHPRALEWFKDALVGALEQEPAEEGLLNVDELRVLPADSVYLRMIGAAPPENRFAALMGDVRMEPVGHVPQGDSLVHVVYIGRGAFQGVESAQTMAMTLRRHEGRWRVDPGDGLLGMMGGGVMYLLLAASMEAEMGGARARP